MTDGSEEHRQAWSADERDAGAGHRDYTADERDSAADARDAAADERDQLADLRETELDEREGRLDEREARLDARDGGPDRDAREAQDRSRAQRAEAREGREQWRAYRVAAAAARGQALDRRTGSFPVLREDAGNDERSWIADRRDFIADRRDYIADERDAVADARDAAADERDHLADLREAELDEREARLAAQGPGQAGDTLAEARGSARARREEARQQRERLRADRNTAVAARTQATQLRTGSTPATGLALTFAEIAQHLYDAENLDVVLNRIADASVAAVPGCEMASITVRDDDGGFRTVASTHEAATAVDIAQYETSEGPCLTAVDEIIVYTPVFPDPRWPALGSRPTEAGVHSAVSYGLVPSGPVADSTLAGSLNAYASTARAFDDEAREIGLILAAHASVAVRAVGERSALEQLGHQLHAALSSRDVIGQAKGILMERLRITPEDAFDTLRRSSQQLNVKLREIAQKLAETGEFTDPDHP